MWRIAGMAFLMGSEAAAGALLGMLIDYWVGTPGRWLLIGGITGIVVGMTTFLRAAFKLNQQINADRSKTPPPHE